MHRLNRRKFLSISAAAAAVATAAGNLMASVRVRRGATVAKAPLDAVKHVVILMQENRSFDHYFGTLRGVCGFDDETAMVLPDGSPVFEQPSANGKVLPFHMDTATTSAHCFGNKANNWRSNHDAWNGGHNDGWVHSKSPLTMGYFTRADLPFHYALADAFTICDNYRCSIMAATGPNRTYLWSGTIDPGGAYQGPVINGGHESGLSWTTYAERLQAAGVRWKVYHVANDNYGDNGLAYFTQFEKARPGDPLHDHGMASVPPASGDSASDIVAALRADVRAGTLPKVSWIVGPPATCEHPEYTPAAGADFMHRILDALTEVPKVWASTVFLINYDENDDFFDHAVPVTPPAGTQDEFVDGMPIGLGARVPLLVVSPWSRGGYVCSELFDHTSVIRFLERCTGVMEPNISAWRRTVCGDLVSAFDFTRTVLDVPSFPETTASADRACDALPAPRPPVVQSMPKQEPGPRPRRSLPYQPNATSALDAIARTLGIEMTNAGTRAVHYSIHANHADAAGPWQYDVLAGTSVRANVPIPENVDGRYDVSVHGPNGFLRRMIGSLVGAGTEVEATSSYDFRAPGNAKFVLTLKNDGDSEVTVAIASNTHRDDGPRTCTVGPHASAEAAWEVERQSDCCYDFSVTLNADASFVRRFAGRIEAGARELLAAGAVQQ
jgi:phospholipase C